MPILEDQRPIAQKIALWSSFARRFGCGHVDLSDAVSRSPSESLSRRITFQRCNFKMSNYVDNARDVARGCAGAGALSPRGARMDKQVARYGITPSALLPRAMPNWIAVARPNLRPAAEEIDEMYLYGSTVCNSIVHEIETQLNNTQDDYELDVVYRISEEKKKVKYSRSEGRILEVLDDICDQIPLRLPSTTKKSKNLLKETCTAFIGEYEDELTHAFFNNFAPARDRVCTTELKVCEKIDGREEL
ncbi:Rxlr-like protein, partial [Globisporangium splendens]